MTKLRNRKLSIFSIIISVLLHSIILCLSIFPINTPPPLVLGSVKHPTDSVSVELIPPTLLFLPNQDTSTDGRTIYPTDMSVCSDRLPNYVGIGITHGLNGRVWTAPPYYPAFKAGMRIDDMILNIDEPIVDGYLTFNVIRDNKPLTFRIKVDTICYTGD